MLAMCARPWEIKGGSYCAPEICAKALRSANTPRETGPFYDHLYRSSRRATLSPPRVTPIHCTWHVSVTARDTLWVGQESVLLRDGHLCIAGLPIAAAVTLPCRQLHFAASLCCGSIVNALCFQSVANFMFRTFQVMLDVKWVFDFGCQGLGGCQRA